MIKLADMRKKKHEKVANTLTEALADHYFDRVGLASLLMSFSPHYTIDKIMELVEYILIFANDRYAHDWEINNNTSEGLVKARDWYRVLEENQQLFLDTRFENKY